MLILAYACDWNKDNSRFREVPSQHSGIKFNNSISSTGDINVIDFQYCYNGGGVGVGDFNGDGLPDLFFTGNQVSSALYLNTGGHTFRDITTTSGTVTESWVTGVSVVDINADNKDDIYLNVGGANCQGACKNVLFVNQGNDEQGIPIFKELAEEYGLADGFYSQQTIFFDVDRDGDLDAYLLRNGNLKFDKNSPMPKRYFPEHLSDVMLENRLDEQLGHALFNPVKEWSTGNTKGFGLGVGIADFDNDGRVDLYAANDFISNDFLFLNKTTDEEALKLAEVSKSVLGHQTYNAMGVDVADINNDLLPDVLVLDMLPFDYERQKRMMGSMNYDKYQLALKNGYSPQFVRNTLQIHNGIHQGQVVPFSEVAFLAGVAKTDWSWAPLIADYDMDGDKDIFISNGYAKDITDLDFINYAQQNNVFGSQETQDGALKKQIAALPAVPLPNFFFRNDGDLNFEDVSTHWSNANPTLSNGAAFVDLDLDGDLDLVVNNIDQQASLLENRTVNTEERFYLKVQLAGARQNTRAIGAKITVWQQGKAQGHFQSVVRGYLSSVEGQGYFGLVGETVDSLRVDWPLGGKTVLHNVPANQVLVLREEETARRSQTGSFAPSLFVEVRDFINHGHSENVSNDFASQRLLATQYSRQGPCLVAAQEKDQSHVVFIGGSHGKNGSLWSSIGEGYQVRQELHSQYEDGAATFFDLEGDGDLDLYVGSGGSEHPSQSTMYQDRVYRNDDGDFHLAKDVLPEIFESTSVVAGADFDNDGDTDLFVGAGISPLQFPTSPSSALLENKNGRFQLVQAPAIGPIGMVRDALWVDLDKDGWLDLIVVGAWMSVKIYKNYEGVLSAASWNIVDREGNKTATEGLWNTIAGGDFDEDGDMDFLLGNEGENNFISPTSDQPIYLYTGDFDNNGSIDPVMGSYFDFPGGSRLMPLQSRDDITRQLVSLKSKYQSYEDFAQVGFDRLLNIKDRNAETLTLSYSSSAVLINEGDKFILQPLPGACQFSSINDFLVDDFDGDGHLDALAIGNDYTAETHFGRKDASVGWALIGDGKGGFKILPPAASGFVVTGQGSDIISLKDSSGKKRIIVGRNDKKLLVFERKSSDI